MASTPWFLLKILHHIYGTPYTHCPHIVQIFQHFIKFTNCTNCLEFNIVWCVVHTFNSFHILYSVHSVYSGHCNDEGGTSLGWAKWRTTILGLLQGSLLLPELVFRKTEEIGIRSFLTDLVWRGMFYKHHCYLFSNRVYWSYPKIKIIYIFQFPRDFDGSCNPHQT